MEAESRSVDVRISKATGGAYADPREVIEDELARLKAGSASTKRADLEHSLATAFVEMQRSESPVERQRHWIECVRLGNELQKLTES